MRSYWVIVLLVAAMCIAAIAAEYTVGDPRTWVSSRSRRVSGQLFGVRVQLRVDLAAPLDPKVTITRDRER
jgi:hypothetical protein